MTMKPIKTRKRLLLRQRTAGAAPHSFINRPILKVPSFRCSCYDPRWTHRAPRTEGIP